MKLRPLDLITQALVQGLSAVVVVEDMEGQPMTIPFSSHLFTFEQ
jgi:hypothetical protein